MFGLSFRKKKIEAAPYIRRLIDATTPNRLKLGVIDSRCEKRYCRALPILMSPMQDDLPNLSGSFAGITQELSDSGLRMISLERLTADEYCATIWPQLSELTTPLSIVCQTKECQPLTANMWSAGFQIIGILEIEDKHMLQSLNQFAQAYFRVS